MKQQWTIRQRPARMDRRYEFDDYEATRSFLERAAELSEREGYYPDMSFGRTYVNVSLQPADEDQGITPELERFAKLLDDLLGS
ncbi:MAG: pterin-4-alpha-carbinolamine dehydratase [Gammaproteobacteria bacterium SG8_47]|nr:MAG: pterin-4-alpha-carbinolamine dehydratase [Gammaproteobacteria bacterium SG8_47]